MECLSRSLMLDTYSETRHQYATYMFIYPLYVICDLLSYSNCTYISILIYWHWLELLTWVAVCAINIFQGWGLLSEFSPFRYFPHFPLLSKQTLAIEYHVYIWQVSPQLSCGDTCQIWMWFRESNRCFCKIENFAYGEISERSFSNPHPCTRQVGLVVIEMYVWIQIHWSFLIESIRARHKVLPDSVLGLYLFMAQTGVELESNLLNRSTLVGEDFHFQFDSKFLIPIQLMNW